MSRDINTFQDLVDNVGTSTVEDFILKNHITFKHRLVIPAHKTVQFGGYTFKKGWTGGDTTADEYTLTAISNASADFPEASGHAMLTMTISAAERIPQPGTTVEVRTTGSEYDGTWEVLAWSAGTSSSTRKLVIAKAYNSGASPAPNFSNAKIRAASVELSGRIVSPDWWRPIFSGFKPGDIRGSFGGMHEVYPEWWTLEDNHHDVAINSAIKSIRANVPAYSVDADESLVMGSEGRVISLAERT